MEFIISSTRLKNKDIEIVCGSDTLSGVRKIAAKVAGDIKAVFGYAPAVTSSSTCKYPVCVGLAGDKLIKDLCVDISDIEGKREVYKIEVIGSSLVITGSDKRGAIYGLFKLSEMLGVSPFIDWLDVKPPKMKEFKIPSDYCMVSKEPSVKYRGFFINDEWPAFGNFCMHNFGGFNAKMYEHVFELLLRLKGNYLWPAMWAEIFPEDGPGLANAELADELGVVMGMSHHEPCLRQGEEYKYLRGPKSIYGDAWNFLKNEKGITRFWEDGLKRSGKFENVITVGMRGEADTAIMGKDATLKDNIDLLRKVLKTQNKLIKKYVNKDLDKVPRMLALYKEVEPYFYGDEKTPGLMGDPELEGVTLMLCDDNFGNLRTVPTPEMRSHKGGYGMYYHFDYHGLPISFEWFNTSNLAKTWEQMTTAYDFGIRDLWIVNVGDIFSNEYPLSFFLDLAYDFDRWGTTNHEAAEEYTKLIVNRVFGPDVTNADKRAIREILLGYTRITSARRTEAMNDKVYNAFNYSETFDLLENIDVLMKKCDKLRAKFTGNTEFSFYELVWLPLTANLNVQRMWLLTTLNHAFCEIGSTYAMTLAKEINKCIAYDKIIVDELHKIHDGKWYGMGLSEHIGFNNWCEEGCKYPVVSTFEPANKERLITTIKGSCQATEGKFWTGRVLLLDQFLDPSCDEATLLLSTACDKDVKYSVENPCKGLVFSSAEGVIKPYTLNELKVKIDRSAIKKGDATEFCIHSSEGYTVVKVPFNRDSKFKGEKVHHWVGRKDYGEDIIKANIFDRSIEKNAFGMNYISILPLDYSICCSSPSFAAFSVIRDYSRGMDAIKAYPQDKVLGTKNAPYLEYKINVPAKGRYDVTLYTNPSNPFSREPKILVGVKVNDGSIKKINMIPEGFAVGDGNPYWSQGVLDNVRKTTFTVDLKEGLNTLSIHAINPNLVLQKIVICEEGAKIPESYLGPKPTYMT
ncbi:MAG: glycosyl hydrolase 115 family protein [Lachnospiraceae bacterium]|nr:glycosyl hydrolase 115 family protein [Lachnospiraceae bacterium]